ncbi:retrovirus-related pol polyprotein from transposon TNT 1-94 [Tanacetum coccineum]
MDENGIVIKNKARLIAQGYNQQVGIDYEETFVPVARLEAIRIFLAYAAYMGFVVYRMDVKSAFVNEKISEEVYVQQPPGFESSEFPNHVCKLDKSLYGLKQAPQTWYETLSNFLFSTSLLELPYVPPNTNWGPKESGVSVNEILFRGMIRSLMYLTASRPDIQFSTCLCVRYQANPKESYLTMIDVSPGIGEGVPQEYVAALDVVLNVLDIRVTLADMMYHFIRDHILKGEIELHFVPTDLQLADIFTKPLAEPSFTRLVVELGMLNIEKQVSDKK